MKPRYNKHGFEPSVRWRSCQSARLALERCEFEPHSGREKKNKLNLKLNLNTFVLGLLEIVVNTSMLYTCRIIKHEGSKPLNKNPLTISVRHKRARYK